MTQAKRKSITARESRSNFYVNFGPRLRVARIVLGLSEAEAAEECDVSLRTYRRWEEGKVQRGVGTVDFLCSHGLLDWASSGDGRRIPKRFRRTKGVLAILPVLNPRTRTLRQRCQFQAQMVFDDTPYEETAP